MIDTQRILVQPRFLIKFVAAMAEPANIALRGCNSIDVGPGDKVLVAGGGIIGSLTAQWAKWLGADYVAMTEINKERAKVAVEFGVVDDVFDPTEEGVVEKINEKVDGGYMRNENNLWGTENQKYAVAYEAIWDLADDTAKGGYATWDEYWAAEGETVAKQMKSVSVMPYLVGTDAMWYLDGVETSEKCDVAPYWFVRHGFADADTSYAVVASLFLAVEEAAEESNLAFGWERNHNGGGNTYYQEFFQWLAEEGII